MRSFVSRRPPYPINLKQSPNLCPCLSSTLFHQLNNLPALISKMIYQPTKRCLCLFPSTYLPNDPHQPHNLKMSSPPATTAAKNEEGTTIPSHPALTLHSTTLHLTLDFTAHPPTFWTGEEFIPFRASLLDTLPLYLLPPSPNSHPTTPVTVTKLIISLLFPPSKTQSNAIILTQRDLISRISGLLCKIQNSKSSSVFEVEVLHQSTEVKGEMEWSQVRCLAPFWGLKGRWRVRVNGRVVGSGSELGTRLLGEWRRMREGRELY